MKKLFNSLLLSLMFIPLYGQAYTPIHIAPAEYNTKRSYVGIDVVSITPQTNGSYVVEFYNSNHNDSGCYTSHNFDWYLAYKGKRVSDYFNTTIRCKRNATKTVYAWPGEVPKGYEKYVTVQFGKEQKPIVKDRRDDD